MNGIERPVGAEKSSCGEKTLIVVKLSRVLSDGITKSTMNVSLCFLTATEKSSPSSFWFFGVTSIESVRAKQGNARKRNILEMTKIELNDFMVARGAVERKADR